MQGGSRQESRRNGTGTRLAGPADGITQEMSSPSGGLSGAVTPNFYANEAASIPTPHESSDNLLQPRRVTQLLLLPRSEPVEHLLQ